MFPSFCRITGHSRGLPKTNYCPLLPPISPKDAKRFISGCRITCNFNPDHHYVPITKFIEEGVIKCKITEKSIYEYKYFLQINFGGCTAPSQSNPKAQNVVSGSGKVGSSGGCGSGSSGTTIQINDINYGSTTADYFYYEFEGQILILPKCMEQELNRGVIKDVQISDEKNKIGFRYINTVKEYDLVSESTDKLQELNVIKGKGLKKNVRKRRKQSALLGDLKAIFEKKEKLAEMAEKQASEKITPDVVKIELIKSKIIHSKAPVFGYMDHNNKFTEVSGEEEVPKHVIKGQLHGGTFTPGEVIGESFVAGKYIDNTFTPGIIKDGQFVPGVYIVKEDGNGKLQKKFVIGKSVHGVFTTGQIIRSKDGSRSEYVPGQIMTFENNVKKFVPGLCIPDFQTSEFKFVPGTVDSSLVFTPSELIETNEGLKFICEKVVEKDSFEIQTFDNTFDFDYEDVKAAAAVCDTLHELVRHDANSMSYDLQDGSSDTRSICTTLSGGAATNANPSRKASIDILEEVEVLNAAATSPGGDKSEDASIICGYEEEHNTTTIIQTTTTEHNGNGIVGDEKMHSEQKVTTGKNNRKDKMMGVTSVSILEKVEENASNIIQKICLEMNLSTKETAGAMEKVLQALKKQEMGVGGSILNVLHSSSSDEMKIELPDTSASVSPEASTFSTADLIFEKVSQQVASVIQPVFAQLNAKSKNPSFKPETVAKVLKELVAAEIVESLLLNQSQVSGKKVSINFDKVKETVPRLIRRICEKMANNSSDSAFTAAAWSRASIDPATLEAVEKVVLEVIKENALQSAIIMTSGLMDPQKSSLVLSTLETSQKAKQDLIIQKLCSQLKLKTSSTEMSVIVEKVLQEFSDPQVLQLICDEIVSESGNRARAVNAGLQKLTKKSSVESCSRNVPPILLKESASTEKVLEDCRKLLVEGYHHEDDFIMGESEVKAADMLKDHVEHQLTRDFNEALLLEAIHLAQVMGKLDVVKELESLLQDDIDYETVVNDAEVLFILRQLVILKKLMAAKKSSSNPGSVASSSPYRMNGGAVGGESGEKIIDLNTNQELIRDSQILTEYVFAQEERGERYFTPPCDEEVKMLDLNHDPHKQQHATASRTKVTTTTTVGKQFQTERTGQSAVYSEESSFFSSTDGTTLMHSKRARLTTDDPDFDEMIDLEPVELLDNSFARHKIEMSRSRHQSQNQKKSTKIALKSAEELQTTTSDQLALINREATLRELIETEQEFVQDLNYVIENYYKALGSGNKLAKYRDLFGSLKPIYEFHQGILLEGFRYYMNEPRMIARTFLRLERYFDNHAGYFEEEPAAQAVLRDDLNIGEYFEELTLSLGDEKSLSDHLKLPLQRINDYQLILQDLIDIQRILKEDTTDLEKALDLLLSIPQKVSDKKFLSNIEGFHGNVFHLGRLLRHDWFTVTRTDVNEVKQRYAFLFKSRILVTKVRKISDERSVFILKDIIKLPDYALEQVNDKKFILKGTPRVYIFESQSSEVSIEWSDILQQCLQPDIAAAQRTEENIRQLKREGSLRRSSRQGSLEPRRASTVDLPVSKLATQDSLRKGSEPTVRGVTIQEISLQEAETLETTEGRQPVERIHTFTRESGTAQEGEIRDCVTKVETTGQSKQSESQEKVGEILTRQTSVKGEKSAQIESSLLVGSSAVTVEESVPQVKATEEQVTGQSSAKSKNQGQKLKVGEQKGETLSVETVRSEAEKSVTSAAQTTSVQLSTELGFADSSQTSNTFARADSQTDSKSSGETQILLDRGSAEGLLSQVSESRVISGEALQQVSTASDNLQKDSGVKKQSSIQKGESVEQGKEESLTQEVNGQISSNDKVSVTKQSSIQEEKAAEQTSVKEVSSPQITQQSSSVLEAESASKAKKSSIKEEKIVAEESKLETKSSSIQEATAEQVSSTNSTAAVPKQSKKESASAGDVQSSEESSPTVQTGKKTAVKEKALEKVGEIPKTSSVSRQESVKSGKVGASETGNTGEVSSSDVPSTEELRQLKRRSSVIRRKSSVADAMSTEGPPPVFAKPLRSVECEPGDNASFECITEVPVIITWLKANRPLDDTLADRVKITSKDNKHSLTLLNCRDEDTGLYTAKITNEKFGVATCSAVLTVHELTPEERQKKLQELNSPQFWVKFHDTELLKDTRVSFMFVVKGKPEPKLTFYHDGMVLQEESPGSKIMKQPDDTYEFCIDKIADDHAGEYKVVAENKYGSAEVTAKVRVVDEKELFKGMEGKRLLNPGEEPHFDWYLNGRPFTPDEKLKVMFREEEDTLALVFQHVTPEDAGLYSVIAQTSGGRISCSAELTVQGAIHQLLKEPCAPTITAELADTEVGVGGSAMMELKVAGYPKPDVTWYKDGKELVAGGRIRFLYEDEESIALIIKNVTKEDGGMYVVKAVNDMGQVETKGRLIVKAPPRFVKKMVDMACMTEEKLAMEVIVEGSPKPEVKWYKDGQLIIASERIKFTELEDGRFQITIERVTLEDSGAYSVVASNAIGQMSEFWNLVAHQPAKIIRKLPAEYTTDLGTKGNQLNFSVQGVPEPTVTCSSSTGKSLKVDNLGGGEYRVNFDCTERQNIKVKAEVKNDFGTDSSECQVYVRRSAQITSKLTNIEAKEGEDVTVKVKVDSYPKPSKVNWFIDGLEISGKKYEQSDSGDEYSLKIKSIARKDDSNKLNVQVKVENELGKDECSASITIKSKPKIKKDLNAKYRLVESSKSQELNVDVDSATFPEPKGTWYHNGQEVNADARIKISKKSSETYNLTFNIIKYEDAGEWSFKAENEVGEVWSKTTIIVEGKPTFKKGLPEQLEVIVSEKMELDVMVQDFCEENVKITWTMDSDIKLESSEVYNKNENSAASKIVFSPTSGCQKLTVTATNKHGETETRSELIHVNLNPPVIKKPLEKETFIKDGQKDVHLKIEVDGSPPPKLTWCLNGEPIGHSSDELIIPVFSAANVGQYTVDAVNVAGSAHTAGAIKMLQTKPTFTKGLQPSYEFKEGLEDLLLSVEVDGSPIPVVVWMKDGIPINPENDPRVSITNADGKSTLRVKNIDPKDKGRYSVSLKNPNGACESSTSVGIKPTPRAPLLIDPLEYPKDINKKERLQIKTKIDGEPMPTVTFFHDGKPMQPHLWKVLPDGTVIMTIDNVQAEDQGVYTIQLENEAGVKKVDTEPITVHEPPQRPGIEPPLGTQRVVEGLPFTFSATLKGYPVPDLTLEKDGDELKDMNYDKDKKTFAFSKACAEPSDAGVYKLIAKNPSGQVASEGKLEVVSRCKDGPKYEPKFIYELCDKAVDEGNELLLLAKIDGNPLPIIRWEFNGSPLSPELYPQTFDGEKAILRVPIVGREHEGVYKCILTNDEGTAESASNVTVNKVYRPPSFAQKFTDQEQIPDCDCKFGARVSGIPVPTAKWFKDGVEIFSGDKYKIKQDGDLVQLQVRNCGDADKALYTCQLSNNQGTAECKAKLDVVKQISHKPRGEIPYFLKTIGNTDVYPGMTAKFTACVGGFPNPEFEWYRGNDKIFESDRIKFERDGAGSGLLRLIIKNVDLGDLADYTLKIWNEHGDAECSAYLKYDTLADLNKQKLGDLYAGYEGTRPTAIPNRPLITNMTPNRMTLKWSPCLPHVSRIPCTYLVESCPVNQPDDWTTLYKGLKDNYCDVEFPNPNQDYKYRIRVQWGQNHVSEPSPYAITMRNKFDTRPPQWKPQLVPSIPRAYDLSRPPHEGYTHAPRFLNKDKDYQYAELGHPSSLYFYVYGYPKPTLKFFRDGKEYHPEHTYLDNGLITLFINRMTEDLEGEYECEARNSIGIANQKVNLHRADHPRFITRPQEVHAMSRRSGKISARIYGIPVPDIKIYKDWHLLPLTSETRVRLLIVDVDEYTIDVHVSIEETMMRDEGLYSIVATNVAGSIHSSAMIHVEESELDYYWKSNLKGKDVRFRNINVRNYYDFGDELGRGTQGIHHHVVERASGASYISKSMITRYDPRRKEWIEAEYNIWNGLNHRYISRLHDAFYHDDIYIFISDICTGGDILHGLISRDTFTEYDICIFIRQLLEGLEYLHVQNHIAHLSLTPLDLLLTHINSNSLRMIDFGLARKYWNKSLEYGHPEYVSPEIVRKEKNIGAWSDMWAVGIITYVLLSGHSPFLGLNDRETLENVKNGAWSFGDRFELISEAGRDFIKRLLVYEWKDRMDITTALDHSWFHMIHQERTDLPNILRDGHASYYYKLKAWNENASCRTIYRRNPLETAYTDPSRMVYPPHYNDDDDFKLPIPSMDHLKLNGYPRPDIDDFVSESHYQSGDETYLLQLRDTDFPARLRQYMKVAASQSPSFQFNVYNTYCDRNIPVIRERRKFTEIMDEEVDDEKRTKIADYSDGGPWNGEPRRIRTEIGNRLDFQAEADAMRSMKREGREPIFREKPSVTVNVRLGQEVTLTVVAFGDPVPGIQWFKQDMMVLSSGENRELEEENGTSTLKFNQVRETDLTNYKIVARNKSGQLISRFRLKLCDEPQGEPVPETINYEIESTPVNISTEEIPVASPLQLLTHGKFGSVILVENSRLLKVCCELEFNTTRALAYTNLFTIHQATQIGSSVLLEDNCLNYNSSSNLLQHISSLDYYSEQLLMDFVVQILDGLQYLHWQGLALLNLEPGNVLVTKNQKIKLVDFSAAQPILKIGSRVDCLTEPEFTAPEVLNGESQCMPQTDTWNVGLLLYIMLSGVSPFLGETDEDTKQNITFVRFRFEHLYSNVSQESTRLLMLIFKRSPLKRPTADELLEHRWFQLSNSKIQKKRDQAVFDTTKIKAYYTNYLEKRKSTQPESNLQDFTSKYGPIG